MVATDSGEGKNWANYPFKAEHHLKPLLSVCSAVVSQLLRVFLEDFPVRMAV